MLKGRSQPSPVSALQARQASPLVGEVVDPRSVGMSASGEPAHTVVSSAYSTCSFPMTPDQPTGAFVDDPNKAWVCNSEDGILKMTLNDFPVTKINALTIVPGWKGTDSFGVEQDTKHAYPTSVMWVINGQEFVQDGLKYGEPNTLFLDHPRSVGSVILVVKSVAAPPGADTTPSTFAVEQIAFNAVA